jgi:hypothetical protein
MKKIPMLEKFAAQSLVYVDTGLDDGKELIFSKEKLAELLVKECVQTIIDNTPALNPEVDTVWELGYNRAMKDCVHHITEHFGVEE